MEMSLEFFRHLQVVYEKVATFLRSVIFQTQLTKRNLNQTEFFKSANLLPKKSSRFLATSLMTMLLLVSTNSVFAETSGLSGLGEPAAPESLAHPAQLFPSDGNGRTTNSALSGNSPYATSTGAGSS